MNLCPLCALADGAPDHGEYRVDPQTMRYRLCCAARSIMEAPKPIRAAASAAILVNLGDDEREQVRARCVEIREQRRAA